MTTELDQIRERLLQAERDLLAAEQAAPAAALRKYTGTPQDGDDALLAGLPELRVTVDQLRLAVTGAEQAAEAERAVANYKADKSRHAGLVQHLSACKRAAAKAARNLAQAHD